MLSCIFLFIFFVFCFLCVLRDITATDQCHSLYIVLNKSGFLVGKTSTIKPYLMSRWTALSNLLPRTPDKNIRGGIFLFCFVVFFVVMMVSQQTFRRDRTLLRRGKLWQGLCEWRSSSWLLWFTEVCHLWCALIRKTLEEEAKKRCIVVVYCPSLSLCLVETVWNATKKRKRGLPVWIGNGWFIQRPFQIPLHRESDLK